MYTIGGILYHHGILGQKWGKRNGPPYPLSEGAHSSSEKKAGYKKSIGGGRNAELYGKTSKKSDRVNKKPSNTQGSLFRDSHNTKTDSNGVRFGEAKNRKQIEDIPGDTLTIEGVDIKNDDDRLMFKNFLDKKGIDTSQLKIVTILGSDMNKAYGLKGENAYKDDFHIQAFDGLDTDDPNVRSTLRALGCRWLEDIVGNNNAQNTQGSFKNESVDPETGFKLKKKDTPPQKDLKVVNPTYKDGGVEARNNCVYCSATFEMRRRGYDVTTNFSKEPMNGFKLYNSMFPGNKQEIIKTSSSNILTSNSVPSNFGFDYRNKGKEIEEASRKALFGENTKHAKEVIAYMKKQKDQRGAIGLGWGVDGGHMACYEVKNGKFTVYDAQIGKEFKGKDLEDLLSATIFCSYARLDNVDVNKKKIKEACK